MTSSNPDEAAWDVPAHDEALYGDRRHAHALVIPVINEGARIRAQLERIAAADLPVDVIVADGGSTDGSLEPAFIRSADVRAVLTKTGPGKLSAQLRMAYAWCLRQGYEGIVTIDGNGKDGVHAVADMVRRLEAGDDYVQGSRYAPGGVAENTPLERTIGNRFVHAPMMSAAGRRWFTDTTNGFRAYSARYLRDPRVRPFREVFQRYELLFYLTVRAGQIGMKVGHVPVERRYPDKGSVPTKITGFRSKLQLFGQAVDAATGGYTPDENASLRLGWIGPAVLILVITALFASNLASPLYSPDSWAYYELSQTIFGDFFQFNHFRTYWIDVEYSSSFPPLFPTTIAVLDAIFQTGARSGYILAFIAFLMFAFISERLVRQNFGVPLVGLGAALALLLDPFVLMGELHGGRAIPLQLVLSAMLLAGLLRSERLSLAGSAWLGVLSGLAVLNRFDAVFLPVLLAFGLVLLTRRPVHAVGVLAGAALAMSPWVVYSMAHFGVPFVTDNAPVAKALNPQAFVTDWWPVPQPSISDDLIAWVLKLTGNIFGLLRSFVGLFVSATGLVLAAAFSIVSACGFLVRAGRAAGPVETVRMDRRRIAALAVFAAITLLMLVPQITTGYFERRYYAAFTWVSAILIAFLFIQSAKSIQQRFVFSSLFYGIIVIAAIAVAGLTTYRSVSDGRMLNMALWQDFDDPPVIKQLSGCVEISTDQRILVLGNDTVTARLGAQGGFRTLTEPRNMRTGALGRPGSLEFLRVWRVEYILSTSPSGADLAVKEFNAAPVSGCEGFLFRVK